jgi:hypothetical protein
MLIEDRDGPTVKWIRWTEAQRLDVVVRQYVAYRIEDKPVLYRMLVDGESLEFEEIEALCQGFIGLLTAQGFDEHTFTWPDQDTMSKLTDLICGELGRLLFELHKWDQFRHSLGVWGRGGTGKSAAVEIVLRAFIDPAKIHQVTSSTEEIFGLANADTKHVISIPDGEPRKSGFGISKSNFKLAAANEAVSIAIKHKDAKVAVTMGAPIVSTSNDEFFKVFGPFQNEADEQAVKDRILSVEYTKQFEGDERVKFADVIRDEAGPILILIVCRYNEMLKKAPKNSILPDWRAFIPYLQDQEAAADPLKEFLIKNIEYKPRERQPDHTYKESTISLRALMGWDGTRGMGGVDGFDGVTWQEMEKRLPGVLGSINVDAQTSFKYDKGETFYACKFCNYDISKNKHTAAAEIFCCGEYEDAHGRDGFELKDGCICYDGGASDGKPKKYKTLPKKNIDPDGVEGPDKEDAACIKNAIWRAAE